MKRPIVSPKDGVPYDGVARPVLPGWSGSDDVMRTRAILIEDKGSDGGRGGESGFGRGNACGLIDYIVHC